MKKKSGTLRKYLGIGAALLGISLTGCGEAEDILGSLELETIEAKPAETQYETGLIFSTTTVSLENETDGYSEIKFGSGYFGDTEGAREALEEEIKDGDNESVRFTGLTEDGNLYVEELEVDGKTFN